MSRQGLAPSPMCRLLRHAWGCVGQGGLWHGAAGATVPHAPSAGPRGLPAPRRCEMQAQPHQYSCCVAAEPGSSWHGAGCSRSAGGLGCHPAACPQPLCSAALAWDGLQGARCWSWAPCSLPCAWLWHRALSPAHVPAALRGSLPRVPLLVWVAWGLPASGTCCSPVATSPWAWWGLLCPGLLPASARGWCLMVQSVLGSRPSVPSCRGVLAALPAPGPC